MPTTVPPATEAPERQAERNLSRRGFLGLAGGGMTVLAAGSLAGSTPFGLPVAEAVGHEVELAFTEALVEMYDLQAVYMWLFADASGTSRFPGPTIVARQGDVLTVRLTNRLDETHAFAVPGTSIRSADVPPGGTATLRFTVPAPGSYLYLDPLNRPVNRLMGLHGALVVLPSTGNTPYARPPARLQRLFDDLGRAAHFPGEPWIPERTKIWVLQDVDPWLNGQVEAGRRVDGSRLRNRWLARYFCMSGLSGFFAAHDNSGQIAPRDFLGRPYLIRVLNAGLNTHALHLHGNHFYVTAVNGGRRGNVQWLDSYTHPPLSRVDWLHPFVRPPDIPGAKTRPLREAAREELAFVDDYGIPAKPLGFPMHCHCEMSQVSAGGNYPGGLVTHWAILGDVDGVPF